MREEKSVTWRSLQPGQEMRGYANGNSRSYFKGFVESASAVEVVWHMWTPDGALTSMPSEGVMFFIEMGSHEFSLKYREGAKQAILAMQNRLAKYEIGYHEMSNGWLYGTPYEIAKECQGMGVKIVGHCTDIVPKIAMFSGDALDIGVCAEYEDGERFWCHYRSTDIERLVHFYGEELGIKLGRVDET